MKNHKALFSSQDFTWGTPQYLFDSLSKEFGRFILDVCATDENAKCQRYYTELEDGLLQPWSHLNWMNPPYGKSIARWIERAYDEAQRGNVTVALLPARTDTTYFHQYIYGKHEIRFIKGRLKFEGLDKPANSAPFPSMIVVFRPSPSALLQR
jgi:phage N-6-adenine-methyltransferase